MRKRESKIARRKFLKDGAVAAAGLTCLSAYTREAITQAGLSGKPLLTEKSINEFIRATPPHTRSFQRRGLEAVRDVKSFVRKHFYLTPAQKQELNSLSREDLQKIQEVVRTVAEKRGELRVFIEGEQKKKKVAGEPGGNEGRHPGVMALASARVEGECSIEIDPITKDAKVICKVIVSKQYRQPKVLDQ